MDYFQGVVAEYLRADRSCFLNTEFYLQNDFSPAEETAKTWFVDILCVNMRAQEAHLCEVTYAKNPQGLLKRLRAWAQHWPNIRLAMERDGGIPASWSTRVWLFVPEASIPSLLPRLPVLPTSPKITPLEMCEPWRYVNWDRNGEGEKPSTIPTEMA